MDERDTPAVVADDGDTSIQPMRRRHLRAVVAIERASSAHPWSHALFASELRMPTSRMWVVARRGAGVIGFGGLMYTGAEAHVTNLAVAAEHRGEGVGSRLLATLVRDAVARGVDDLTLEVRVGNDAAQAMYRRFGFAPGGIRPRYYRDNGEDALIMWAHDIASPGGLARLEAIEASLRERAGVAS